MNPVMAATVNLTLDVAQKTNVLNPYTITNPNNAELTKMSTFRILETTQPPRIKIPNINIESPDRNIECLIFKFIP